MEDKHRRGRRRRWSRRRRTASRWPQTRRCPTPPTWTLKCWPCSTCRRCWTRRTRAGCSLRFAASSSVKSAQDRIASASLLTHRPTLRCRTAGWPPATIVLRWADDHLQSAVTLLTKSQEVLGVKCLVSITLMVDQCGHWDLSKCFLKVLHPHRVALTSLMAKVICSSWMNWKNSSQRIKSKRRGISQVIKISQRSPPSHSAEAWKCTMSSFKPLLGLTSVISD